MEKESISQHFKLLQESICTQIEQADGTGKFIPDIWTRNEGGGGDSRVMQKGKVLEKAGVNFSAVYGPVSDQMKKTMKFDSEEFYATGVSIVMHPENPFVPIIHMNVRYFETGELWWFGGGIDLTPIYVLDEDAKFFHSKLKSACDKHDIEYYPKFRKWADDYFYLPHRNETRGIGGIFFDKLGAPEKTKDQIFDFVMEVGNTFAPVYSEILNRNKTKSFTSENKYWQSVRRSRYVEFNLLYDRGTKFGLDSNGRTESILMSMPPVAEWPYNYKPAEPGPEHDTLKSLVKNKAWI